MISGERFPHTRMRGSSQTLTSQHRGVSARPRDAAWRLRRGPARRLPSRCPPASSTHAPVRPGDPGTEALFTPGPRLLLGGARHDTRSRCHAAGGRSRPARWRTLGAPVPGCFHSSSRGTSSRPGPADRPDQPTASPSSDARGTRTHTALRRQVCAARLASPTAGGAGCCAVGVRPLLRSGRSRNADCTHRSLRGAGRPTHGVTRRRDAPRGALSPSFP